MPKFYQLKRAAFQFPVKSVAAAVVFVAAAAAAIGWFTKIQFLVQPFGMPVPMQFNTALCLLFLIAGWIFEIKKSAHRFALYCALASFTLALLTVLQYPLNTDFRIDRLFVDPFLISKPLYPGRMGPNTGIALSLLAANLAIISQYRSNIISMLVAGCCALLAVVASASTIVAYCIGLDTVLGWSDFMRMAPHTAACLFVLACLLAFEADAVLSRSEKMVRWWKGCATYALGLAIALVLWIAAASSQSARLADSLERAGKVRTSVLQHAIDSDIDALTGVERLFAGLQTVSESQFQFFTRPLLDTDGALDAIDWTPRVSSARRPDDALTLQPNTNISFPVLYADAVAGSPQTIGLDVYSEAPDRRAMDDSARAGQPRSSPIFGPISDTTGKRADGSIAIAMPVYADDQYRPGISAASDEKIRGFVIGELRIDRLFTKVFGEFPSGGPKLDIFEDTGDTNAAPIYSYISPKDESPASGAGTALQSSNAITEFTIAGHPYLIRFSSTPAYMARQSQNFASIIFFLSLIIALLSSTYVNVVRGKKERIRESEERFRASFYHASQGNALIGIDGKWLRVNPALCTMTGFSEVELLAKTLQSVTHPEDLNSSMGGRSELLARSREVFEEEIRYCAKDGKILWVLVSTSLVRSEHHKPLYFVSQIQDISARKNAEAELQEESVRQALIIQTQQEMADSRLDLDKLMSTIVERSQDLTHAEGGVIELLEENMMVYHAASGIAASHIGLRIPKESSLSGRCIIENTVLYCDDTELDLRANREASAKIGVRSMVVVPLQREGRAIGVLKVLSSQPRAFDRRAINLLQLMAGIISTTMKDATSMKELQRSKEAAESAMQAKGQFLANMSHEIRTPLTAILGFTEQLQDAEMPAKDRESLIQIVLSNAQFLLDIVNDVLDFSKIEAGKLRICNERCDLFELLNFIQNALQRRAREKNLSFGVEYTFPFPQFVETDPMRLKQVLFNLIGNAIKFTEHGSVKLVARYESESSTLRFSIVDTGIGLTPDQSTKLFEIFSQADASTTKRFGGTGLGLAISKRLAGMLGGDISMESQYGQGSVFTLSINSGHVNKEDMRLGYSGQSAKIEHADKPAHTLSGAVLVAEDGIDNQRLMRRLLEKNGLTATFVENGELAVSAALKGKFDLILMDMQMPVLDGYTATSRLRNAGCAIPIVACTADASRENAERVLSIGCTDLLFKPFSAAGFRAIIEKYAHGAHNDVGLSSDEMRELRAGYLSRLPQRMNELNDAIARNDSENIARIAHKLAAATMFGFSDLALVAHALEAAINSGAEYSTEELLHVLRSLSPQTHASQSG